MLVAFVAAWMFVGCGGGSSGPAGPGTGGSGAGGSDGGITCTPGSQCVCSDGRLGVTSCNGGSATCDCSSCPAFVPGTQPAWQACGGDPFGRWRTVADDLGGFKLGFASGGVQTGTCSTQLVDEKAPVDVRLELHSGGDAVITEKFGSATYDVLQQCIDGHGYSSCALKSTGNATFSCTQKACGICTCDEEGTVAMVFTGTWTRKGSTLTITDGSTVYSADYCIQNGELTLRDASGILVTLQPAHVTGSPEPCAQRSQTECTLGSGCKLGACLGGGTCSSKSDESSCTNVAGCSWSPTACAGQAAPCALEDYDVVPGCAFVSGTYAGCGGYQVPCSSRLYDTCTDNPGCNYDGFDCKGTAEECTGLTELECESLSGCTVELQACPDGDSDGDGVCNSADICPGYDDKIDSDGDGVPDGCDPCPHDNPDADSDGDGVCDSADVCPGFDDKIDTDGDGVPDGCDPCPNDNPDDPDGDGVCTSVDVCPGGDDKLDADGDGIPDACDLCPINDSTGDSDGTGFPDACEVVLASRTETVNALYSINGSNSAWFEITYSNGGAGGPCEGVTVGDTVTWTSGQTGTKTFRIADDPDLLQFAKCATDGIDEYINIGAGFAGDGVAGIQSPESGFYNLSPDLVNHSPPTYLRLTVISLDITSNPPGYTLHTQYRWDVLGQP